MKVPQDSRPIHASLSSPPGEASYRKRYANEQRQRSQRDPVAHVKFVGLSLTVGRDEHFIPKGGRGGESRNLRRN